MCILIRITCTIGGIESCLAIQVRGPQIGILIPKMICVQQDDCCIPAKRISLFILVIEVMSWLVESPTFIPHIRGTRTGQYRSECTASRAIACPIVGGCLVGVLNLKNRLCIVLAGEGKVARKIGHKTVLGCLFS